MSKRGKTFFSLKLEGQSGVLTRDLRLSKQAILKSLLTRAHRPIWGLANHLSHLLTIIILTFWWLEHRMSKVLILCVLDYHYV